MKNNLISYTLILFIFGAKANAQNFPKFINKTKTYVSQGSNSTMPGGMADINGDLVDDLVVLNKGTRLTIGLGSSDNLPLFTLPVISTRSNIPEFSLTVGDLTNNGFPEVVTAGISGFINVFSNNNNVFTNNSLFSDVYAQASNLLDINNDGWLDLFVCDDIGPSKVFINDQNGNLNLVPNYIDFSTIPASDMSGNYGSEWVDVNGDGKLDLAIAKCRAGVEDPTDPRRVNALYIANANGTYTNRAREFGFDIGHQSWVVAFGDIDNDGDQDAFIANHYAPHQLLENIDGEYFQGLDFIENGYNSFAFQVVLRDFDNDGYLDILLSSPTGLELLKNNGDKTFTIIKQFDSIFALSFTVGDINDDGFLDIYTHLGKLLNSPGTIEDRLYINQGNSNNFVKFNLEGTTVNKSGIGSRIQIFGDWGVQTRVVKSGESYGITNSLQQHFGLGNYNSIDSVVVSWTDGSIQKYYDLSANQTYFIQQNKCISTQITISSPSMQILPNETISIEANEGYESYLWSDGSEDKIIAVDQPGVYFVKMEDENNCVTVSKPIRIVSACFTNDSKILDLNEKEYFCSNQPKQLISIPAKNYLWSTGQKTSSIDITQSGIYYITVVDFCDQTFYDSVQVTVHAIENPIIVSPSVKTGEQAILTSSQENTYWFSNINEQPLFFGLTYQTEPLTKSTTFFAQSFDTFQGDIQNIGMDKFPPEGQYGSDMVSGGLRFDVHKTIHLNTLKVKTDKPGQRKLIIRDDEGGLIFSKTFDLVFGENLLRLDAQLAPGINYIIRTDSTTNVQSLGHVGPRLLRHFSNEVKFPYEIPNVVSISSSLFGLGYFYYFYDWEISFGDRFCFSDFVTCEVEVDSSSSTNNLTKISDIQVFPNPSNNVVIFQNYFSNQVHFELQNITGTMLNSGTFEEKHEFDLSSYLPGIYLLKFRIGDTLIAKKIVKY